MKHVIEKEGKNKISMCMKSYRNPHTLRNRLATGWENHSCCSVLSHGWMQQVSPAWPKSHRQH